MNTFLRLSVALATIAVSSAHASTSTFIPAEANIESPTNNATAVSNTPRFESSLPTAINSDTQSAVEVSQTQTDWLLYAPDENIILFGGAQSSSEPGIIAAESTKTIELPFSITVFDNKVTKMTVSQAGDITFKSDAGIVLAEMAARIDHSYYTQSSNTHSLAAIKFLPTQILIQWYHKSIDNAPDAWQSDIQAIITSSGIFGIRLSENNYTNDIFNLTTGHLGCSLRNTDSTLFGKFTDLADWKSLAGADENFSVACQAEGFLDHSVNIVSFEEAAPVMFDLPELSVITSDAIQHQLSNEQALENSTVYALQARHHVKETSDISANPVIKTSAFGEAVSFVTEGIDLALEVSISSNLNFVVDQAKKFSLTITNNNAEVAHPTAQIILPFDFTQNLNGSTSDFFNSSVDGGTCTVGLDNNQTTLSCLIPSLAAGASATIQATATMPNADIKQIQYKVCETAFCSSKSATSVSVTVTTQSSSNDDTSSTKASSSSSGGSLFWIFAALPLLRRRRA